jgi:5'-nucleotidase
MESHSYSTAARIVKELIERLMADPLPADTILNINVPDVGWGTREGIEATYLGHRHRSERLIKTQDPGSQVIYWVGPPGPEKDMGPGTDLHAVRHCRVSVTPPLTVDLACYSALDKVSQWLCSGLA